MKQILFSIIFLFINLIALSQSRLGVINDSDGYTNIRSIGDISGEVIGKIYEEDLFNYFESSESNWWLIEIGEGVLGYVHKSRIAYQRSGYLFRGQELDSQVFLAIKTRKFGDISIQTFQIRSKDPKVFTCRAWIKTISNNGKLLQTKKYDSIEPVGSNFGLTIAEPQPWDDIFVMSKFGDYEGQIIVVNSQGEINSYNGGNYFVTEDQNYIVSPWYSDLSGITIIDLKNNEVHESEILSFNLGKWRTNGNEYFAPLWSNSEELDDTYRIDFNSFTLIKSSLKKEEGKLIKLENAGECLCE